MKNQSWTHIDKDKWPRGPWDNEPDKEQWVDIGTGLPCLIVRHITLGHLCGYVGVGKGHSMHGKGFEAEEGLEVHGGITFGQECHSSDEGPGFGVCHLTEAGDEDPVWWLGFDMAHCGDYSPGMFAGTGLNRSQRADEVYKTVAYVKDECRALAKQLA